MVVKCVKDNYNARFRTPSYQCCREMYLISRLDINFDKVSGACKCRSGEPAHDVCLKSVSRTITMQAFTTTATTVAEKCTLFLDSTQKFDKVSGA